MRPVVGGQSRRLRRESPARLVRATSDLAPTDRPICPPHPTGAPFRRPQAPSSAPIGMEHGDHLRGDGTVASQPRLTDRAIVLDSRGRLTQSVAASLLAYPSDEKGPTLFGSLAHSLSTDESPTNTPTPRPGVVTGRPGRASSPAPGHGTIGLPAYLTRLPHARESHVADEGEGRVLERRVDLGCSLCRERPRGDQVLDHHVRGNLVESSTDLTTPEDPGRALVSDLGEPGRPRRGRALSFRGRDRADLQPGWPRSRPSVRS